MLLAAIMAVRQLLVAVELRDSDTCPEQRGCRRLAACSALCDSDACTEQRGCRRLTACRASLLQAKIGTSYGRQNLCAGTAVPARSCVAV